MGTADSAGPCQQMTVSAEFTYFRCDSAPRRRRRRQRHPDPADDPGDIVWLQSDQPYTVSQPLNLTGRVTVYGRGPRTTTVSGAGTARVFTVAAGAEANIYRMTIAGGNAFPADGGNILNSGRPVPAEHARHGRHRSPRRRHRQHEHGHVAGGQLVDRPQRGDLARHRRRHLRRGRPDDQQLHDRLQSGERRARERRRHRDEHGRRPVRGDDRAQHVHQWRGGDHRGQPDDPVLRVAGRREPPCNDARQLLGDHQQRRSRRISRTTAASRSRATRA